MRFTPAIVLFLLLLTACRKKDRETQAEQQPPDYPKACAFAKDLKKVWIWDSTFYMRNDSVLFCYTPTALKTYTSGTTDTLVRTVCNFSLDLATKATEETGCTRQYSISLGGAPMATGVLEGVYQMDDSLHYMKEEMKWIVTQKIGNTDEYVYLDLSNYVFHEGVTASGYITIGVGYHNFQYADPILMFERKGSSILSRSYFHKSN